MAGRVLIAFEKMPDRATSAERVAAMEADVRDAAGKLRKRITDKASTFSVSGYALDEDSWEVAFGGLGSRTLIMRATVRRPN